MEKFSMLNKEVLVELKQRAADSKEKRFITNIIKLTRAKADLAGLVARCKEKKDSRRCLDVLKRKKDLLTKKIKDTKEDFKEYKQSKKK